MGDDVTSICGRIVLWGSSVPGRVRVYCPDKETGMTKLWEASEEQMKQVAERIYDGLMKLNTAVMMHEGLSAFRY